MVFLEGGEKQKKRDTKMRVSQRVKDQAQTLKSHRVHSTLEYIGVQWRVQNSQFTVMVVCLGGCGWSLSSSLIQKISKKILYIFFYIKKASVGMHLYLILAALCN